uniref:Uncharacterized protein n=2 Tax=Clastoptera arizonana TaxID=38151 RepID=A0A1B6CVA1_9HEMI
MSADDGITSTCQFRLVPTDYVIDSKKGLEWADYQEPQSEELAQKTADDSLKQLEEKNLLIWSKIVELVRLRKEADKIELKNLKRERVLKEINRLKEKKKELEERDAMEMKRMEYMNEINQLEKLEAMEVNNTLMKQQQVSDLYKDMLGKVIEKEQQERRV